MKQKPVPPKDYSAKDQKRRSDKPIPEDIYPVIDTDLARDNIENDLPAADLSDL